MTYRQHLQVMMVVMKTQQPAGVVELILCRIAEIANLY